MFSGSPHGPKVRDSLRLFRIYVVKVIYSGARGREGRSRSNLYDTQEMSADFHPTVSVTEGINHHCSVAATE